jgi:hypothetical protein
MRVVTMVSVLDIHEYSWLIKGTSSCLPNPVLAPWRSQQRVTAMEQSAKAPIAKERYKIA